MARQKVAKVVRITSNNQIAIPAFIVREPRIIDIAPTILKLLELEPPASVDGRSLL